MTSQYWTQWDDLKEVVGVEKFIDEDNLLDPDEVIIDEIELPFYQDVCSDRDFL